MTKKRNYISKSDWLKFTPFRFHFILSFVHYYNFSFSLFFLIDSNCLERERERACATLVVKIKPSTTTIGRSRRIMKKDI